MSRLRFGVPFTLGVIFLAACASTEIRLGWLGSARNGESTYRFERFSGDEAYTTQLEKDQTLRLSYDVSVDDGLILLYVSNPNDRAVWEQEIAESKKDAVEIRGTEAGRYHLVVKGEGAKGSFALAWEIE